MIRKWKLLTILAGSAVIGVTAIAFASDLISTNASTVVKPNVTNLSIDTDICRPGECSIVLKADANEPSEVIIAR